MNPQETARQQLGHNIAMWGTPGSGKTTFLGALSIALSRQDQGWKLVGSDVPSTDALIKLATDLAGQRKFPQPTQGIERYRWNLVGAAPGRRRRRPWGGPGPEAVQIGLDLRDPTGEVYALNAASEDLVERLVKSRGIIYLFDPVWEFVKGNSFDYLYGVLLRIAHRMVDAGEFSDGSLPHYLAVCITKFDDVRVLETAEKLRLVTPDTEGLLGFPRVGDDDARALFRWLCEVSRSGNAELVLNMIKQFFHEDRVRYYVTSSIGFYVDPEFRLFDPDDVQNLIPDPDNPTQMKIRGPVYPINVTEPVTWLAQELAAQDRSRR
ncbi:hypothetical protein ETD83_05640 [Actinomadura soli]|uniref:Uncharacterized protein n=1 Tax=Actinomadura soli TaxID=2508997 RepID=A0A5C4JIV7_9ACTN|nr:hypothetical protein [Actinomadura soli]TMR05721.1 hypothetical protein ETD83_05640 [Actinomadura soli]